MEAVLQKRHQNTKGGASYSRSGVRASIYVSPQMFNGPAPDSITLIADNLADPSATSEDAKKQEREAAKAARLQEREAAKAARTQSREQRLQEREAAKAARLQQREAARKARDEARAEKKRQLTAAKLQKQTGDVTEQTESEAEAEGQPA